MSSVAAQCGRWPWLQAGRARAHGVDMLTHRPRGSHLPPSLLFPCLCRATKPQERHSHQIKQVRLPLAWPPVLLPATASAHGPWLWVTAGPPGLLPSPALACSALPRPTRHPVFTALAPPATAIPGPAPAHLQQEFARGSDLGFSLWVRSRGSGSSGGCGIGQEQCRPGTPSSPSTLAFGRLKSSAL